VVGSLSKSDKHFQLIFGIFYNFACRCKKYFECTCRRLDVSRSLRSSCFYSRGLGMFVASKAAISDIVLTNALLIQSYFRLYATNHFQISDAGFSC